MSKLDIVFKKYDNLNEQVKNLVISPCGEIVYITYGSHDSYIYDIIETLNLQDKIDTFKETLDIGQYISDTTIAIALLGVVSVHTSGNNVGWIQGPRKINSKQINAIKTDYALGKLPELLYTILSNYNKFHEVSTSYILNNMSDIGDGITPLQINIKEVRPTDTNASEEHRSIGYKVSCF